jgi:Flp pilus assembly protein TadD
MWAERGENLEQALSLIQRAIAIEPDNGAFVDSLGWVCFQLGRYDEARQHLEWAARLVPDDPTILEHLGDLYVVLQDLERARNTYRQALDLGTGDSIDELRRKLRTIEQQGL